MTNKEAIEILRSIRVYDIYPKSASEETKQALDFAIKALEFSESQRICCDNCVNHNRMSKEVCTSPYGQCVFFDDKTQKGGENK